MSSRRWSAAVTTPAAAAGAAFCTIRAAAGARARIVEIGVFANAATSSSIQLIRSNNAFVATTSVLLQPEDHADVVGVTNVDTAWSTAPTIQTVPIRRILTAGISQGVIWTFEELIVGPPGAGSGLVLWNFGGAAASALSVYVAGHGLTG